MGISLTFRRRTVLRLLGGFGVFLFFYTALSPGPTPAHEIAEHGYIERVIQGSEKYLDVQKVPSLQTRMGRDDSSDMLSHFIDSGSETFWSKFQIPFMESPDTAHIDLQAVRSAIEDLLSLHGWVAAACPTLNRPFGHNKLDGVYDDLSGGGKLYYIAIVLHSADHFLVDQLATIVQLARRLGTKSLFVSMLDYDSRDSTPTLTDLSEAVLTLLGIPFRIRRVPTLTEDEATGYYPLEEAYTRNLVLEPLHELYNRRGVKFDKVIWLKGFTCPNDVLENIKVAQVNQAAMTCGMDWAEHNGFFVFSDRWRTRDIDGDQFRGSRSVSSSAPVGEEVGAERYNKHLPFQVFCCESGTHTVDPAQTYYRGVTYRSSHRFFNLSSSESVTPPSEWDPYGECMDSTQAWFCRDIWVSAAKAGVKLVDQPLRPSEIHTSETLPARKRKFVKRQDSDVDDVVPPNAVPVPPPAAALVDNPAAPIAGKPMAGKAPKPDPAADHPDFPNPPARPIKGSDANMGSNFDTVPDSDTKDPSSPASDEWQSPSSVPNSDYEPARILINPRCVTTYAGVSHTRLANDLFGPDKDEGDGDYDRARYVLDQWSAAPDSYVCQEQRFTGGRKSPKNQRSSPFSIHTELRARAAPSLSTKLIPSKRT